MSVTRYNKHSATNNCAKINNSFNWNGNKEYRIENLPFLTTSVIKCLTS